jgi:hypothetical protein
MMLSPTVIPVRIFTLIVIVIQILVIFVKVGGALCIGLAAPFLVPSATVRDTRRGLLSRAAHRPTHITLQHVGARGSGL